MIISAFSDTHGKHNRVEEFLYNNPGDILIFAGDFENMWFQRDDFIKWISKFPYDNKIIVSGNHDASTSLGKYDCGNGVTILNHASMELNGLKFFGSPFSVTFGNWWFMKDDAELDIIWKEIPDDTDILITHSPPFGILDKTVTYEKNNAGSHSLLKRIDEINLRYHFFGHIHEGFGYKTDGHTEYYNVSTLDEKYLFKNLPTRIEI